MHTNATDFLLQFSKQKLEAELRTLRQIADEKRKIKDRAVKEYTDAANRLAMCEQLLAVKQTSEHRESLTVPVFEEGRDQTSAVLGLVRGTGSLGIRPKDIAKALASGGITVKPAYLHTILMRLKKRGDVKSVRGSYIPVE
jgi:hypothetical protein